MHKKIAELKIQLEQSQKLEQSEVKRTKKVPLEIARKIAIDALHEIKREYLTTDVSRTTSRTPDTSPRRYKYMPKYKQNSL